MGTPKGTSAAPGCGGHQRRRPGRFAVERQTGGASGLCGICRRPLTHGSHAHKSPLKTVPKMSDTSKHQVMIIHDGGSLAAFERKGNLTHYVEVLYNPGNFFQKAHILA